MNHILDRAWAEVDLDNIANNAREIRRITNAKSHIMGIVKADAYGHGVVEVTKTLLENGVDYLGVSILDEALQLRYNGIGTPILVLNYTDPRRASEVVEFDLTQAVFSLDAAKALSDEAVRMGRNLRIHIKIDTGMSRVGFDCGHDTAAIIREICRLPRVIVEGLFTHFASADETDGSYTYLQFQRFMQICGELEKEGVSIPLKHAANSAAAIEYPEMHLDMIRAGILLYGLYPSPAAGKKVDLRPAMTFKSNVSFVKRVKKGTPISYGRTYTAGCDSVIATVPVGYADGYARLLSNRGEVLINGETAPVVGRICMDQFMVDVTDIGSEVRTGDEAVLFGRQGQREISIDEVAQWIGTINYEIVCMVGKRVPRIYFKEGRITGVRNCVKP